MATRRHQPTSDRIDYTPGSAVTGGQIITPGGGLIGAPERDIAANELDALHLSGLREYDKAAGGGVTFAVGDTIYYNNTTGLAVPPSLTLDPSADIEAAVCVLAAADADTFVVGIPVNVLDRYNVIRPIVYEFDCDGDNGDTDEHILIPAWMNRHGLLFMGAWGLVTEQMAGSSEDQGVVTVEDEDDNALATITASNSGADAVNDVIVGTNDIYSATTGDAAKVVAAGKAIQGFVSQQTSGGTPAGKIKVYVEARPLV